MTDASLLPAVLAPWLGRVRAMRRSPQRYGLAPHKPLLLLLAVARIDADPDSPRLMAYDDWAAPLRRLLEECNTSVADQKPQEPIWRLQRDGLWEVTGDDLPVDEADGVPLARLAAARCGLPEELHHVLSESADARHAVIREAADLLDEAQRAAAVAILFDGDPGGPAGDPVAEDYQGEEARRLTWHRRAERNRTLAARAKQIHGDRCAVCGLRMAETYGPRGEGYIEAHHRTPVSELRHAPLPVVLDARADFVVVCPNCHRMLHRRPSITPEELAAELRARGITD